MIDVIIGYDDRNKIAHAARVRQRGYLQVKFVWSESGFKYEARAHTAIPNSPGAANGNVWVASRKIISDGTFQPYQEFLVGNNWIRGNIWFDLIEKQKAGTITEIDRKILIKGHFKLK